MINVAAAARSRLDVVRLGGEWTWVTALTLGVAGYYVALRAPVLDPPSSLDPWIYTASFRNFHFIYDVFGWTYYPSRLPWIIPGVVAHALFGPVAAFFVLHALFFFAAGLFAYLLFRRFFGPAVALAAYALLMLSPLFYDAYSNDYPDGALITYLLGGVYFGLTAYRSRRPWLRAFWAGFFLAAAIGTNLFAGIVIACLLLAYAVVRLEALRAPRALALEAGFGAAGALALLVVCGTFSRAYGGSFFFFLPQWRALQGIHAADYKVHGSAWVLSEPQLLLPAFGVALVVALLVPAIPALRRRFDDAHRLAVGAAIATGVLYALIVVWEFAFTGNFLETTYYFSLFNVGIVLCLGAALGLLGIRGPAVAVVAVAAVVPTLLVFVKPVLPVGRHGAIVTVALMAVATLAALLRPRVARLAGPSGTLVLLALVAFTAIYAADAGAQTRSTFARDTYTKNRDVQDVALQLMRFMKQNRIEQVPFGFWYAPREDQALNGIQSVYLWGDTWVGLDLPRIDASMRRLLDVRKPSVLVLLCKQRSCHDAASVLAHAGYANRPLASGVLAAGDERVYVRAVTLPRYAAVNRERNTPRSYYLQGQSPPVAAVRGRTLTRAVFARGAPSGWSGDAANTARGGTFETSTQPWGYELTGPPVGLQPGAYTVYARGRVLTGGLDLGVLDVDHNKWIEQRFYWSGQRRALGRGWMATPFTVTAATKVQVILSNWVPSAQQSKWQLREIRLVRSP